MRATLKGGLAKDRGGKNRVPRDGYIVLCKGLVGPPPALTQHQVAPVLGQRECVVDSCLPGSVCVGSFEFLRAVGPGVFNCFGPKRLY